MRMRYFILLLLAARVDAQRLDTLYVGHAPLSTAYLRNDSSESLVMVPDGNGTKVIGRSTTRQRVVDGKLFRVVHFSSARADVTDSVMTGGTGVLPGWEISHQTSKVMHLKWDGRVVTGDVTPTGKPREMVDQQMTVAPFNSSDVEQLIQSLPLKVGYAALMATYEYETPGGLRLDTLAVTGREQNAWIVRVSRGGSSSMTVWMDADTKRVIKEEFAENPQAWRLRIVRQ
jgi:hypothetical protein